MTRCPANVVKTTHYDLLYLCQRMRPDEIEQLRAFFPMDDYEPEMAALMFANKGGPKFTLVDSAGLPLVAGGWESISDGVCQSWMVGTMAAWESNWRSITKSARWMMDAMLEGGIRRLQTSALASRSAACSWYIDGLRMTPEGIWRGYGRQGQDVAFFSRLAGE